jgi:hypothetical protein
MSKFKSRHPLSWFKTGKTIIKDSDLNLFSQRITIESEEHGKALHATQDRGIRYKSI